MEAEGWYQDPYRRHEARWFSDGTPTALVSDHGVESHDAPPDTPITEALVPLTETEDEDGSDLLRSDAADPADRIFDPNAAWVARADGSEDEGGQG
jgi:hypothetical protein